MLPVQIVVQGPETLASHELFRNVGYCASSTTTEGGSPVWAQQSVF